MIKRILATLGIGTFILLAPAAAFAQFEPLDQACSGNASTSDICDERNQQDNPVGGTEGILIRAANLIAIAVGVAAVIMIIIGGIKITTSSGDSNSVKSGRDTIIYAIIGVVVTLLARAIIIFVVNRL